MTAPALQFNGIRKQFRELLALDGADFVLRRGTVHPLLGENGAGKTPMRIAFGLIAPDDGTITVDGVRIRRERPGIRSGIGMQHFALVAGERLGVAGVEGSGIRELLYALAGRLSPLGGDLHLPDEIGFVPEDRQEEALLLAESIADNIALKGAGRRRGWVGQADIMSLADRLTRAGEVRARDVRAPVSTLSGGNQQRLVLARELDGRPPLVAVNSTRGLDLAAYEEIRQRLREAARAGMAIVYYTADLDELTAIAGRVVVVFEGRVREVARDRDAVGRAMLGAA